MIAHAPLKFAVVGCGYWGPNFVRNLHELDEAVITWMCDKDEARLEKIGRRYPKVRRTTNYAEVLASKDVDAVIIATPVSTHFDLGMAALQAGKHVLIEKPLAATAEQARQLIAAAKERGLVAAVDHTFVYTAAVRKIRSLLEDGTVGDLCYIDSVRVNLGLFQNDVNVIWDLAVHDLSIIDYVIGNGLPLSVSATGAAHVGTQENLAYISLVYPNNLIAHVHASWLAPVKVRRMLVGGTQRMIIYDDVEPSEKIKVYDRGADAKSKEEIYKTLIQYRTGDTWIPFLDNVEALGRELREFTAAVLIGAPIPAPAEAGLRIVQILEAATESIRRRGAPIDILAPV
jgi:predicted dehydrogenase